MATILMTNKPLNKLLGRVPKGINVTKTLLYKMVILTIYTNHIKVKYKTTLISKGTFFVFSLGMLSIVLPFIIAYKSGGFWLKRDIFYEQPQINFKGDYLVMATTNNASNPVICSTLPYHKENLDFLDVCSIIKLREIDENLDGKIDKINLEIGIETLEYKVTSINILLPIQYKLNAVCPLQMQSAIVYQHYFHTSASDIKIIGDLVLFQSEPIQCYRKGIHELYDYSVENADEGYELENIVERYWERNISTQLSNIFTTVVNENKDKFNIKLTVRYPEHKICYEPGFWQIIKWAWMQYFAIYVIIAWFTNGIKTYLFNNKLVLFYKDSPLEKYK